MMGNILHRVIGALSLVIYGRVPLNPEPGPEPAIPEFTPYTATAKVARRLDLSNIKWEI